MKTEKHPYSKRIHYATGGEITKSHSAFHTRCGRTFEQGHSELMQSGYAGAQNVSCKNCKQKLLKK